METVIFSAMVGVLLLLSVLVLGGRRALPRKEAGSDAPFSGPWPRLALIVPVTGAAPDLAGNLRSLLTQDYPDYQVVFVTRQPADPATGVILSQMREHPRARLVCSGPASCCGQKNHNLLAGLRLVGEEAELLAFCDATHLAPAGFLSALAQPILRGEASVTSGYHQVLPEDAGLATLGRAVTVLVLCLTKGFPRLNQPWGGATAIRRSLWENLQVGKRWAENVVDDVSLAARLQQDGIPVGWAPGACLATPLAGETLAAWSRWLTRQWLYLKFCLPGAWVAAGLIMFLTLGLAGLAAGRCLLALLGWVSALPALEDGLFLLALTGLGAALRRLHPHTGPLWRWLLACFTALGLACWCHAVTWAAREIKWRDLCYRVSWRGKVTAIREVQSSRFKVQS
jgi:cellulose synthase/poly-beta-1,6-N-acetylglucosamine synthase-like glycosyltransferase